MATNSTGNSVTKTISLDPDMAIASEARAKSLGFRSYSAYCQSLLRKDLSKGGNMTLEEKIESKTTKTIAKPPTKPVKYKK